MFYAHFVLAKKGPLARIWLAAHWDKKLTKAHVYETNIEKSVEGILQPKVKMALRTTGHLLLGIVRIYSRKAKYLLADCNEAFVKIKMAFRPGAVDLPEDNREAAVNAITLPEVFHDFDTVMPTLDDLSMKHQFSISQVMRIDEITLREEEGIIAIDFDNGFGEMMDHDDEPEEEDLSVLRDSASRDQLREPSLLFDQDIQGRPNTRSNRSQFENSKQSEIPNDLAGGSGGGLFDDLGELNETGAAPQISMQSPRLEESFHEDDFQPPSPGGLSSLGGGDMSRPGSPFENAAAPPPTIEESIQSMPGPSGMSRPSAPTAFGSMSEHTTLLHDEEESFALEPVDASAIRGHIRPKRKRKLIVDDVKAISGDDMKCQLADTEDILMPLDLAPPTKRLLFMKEIGATEKLMTLSSRYISSSQLIKLFDLHSIQPVFEGEEFFGLPGDTDRDRLVLDNVPDAISPTKGRKRKAAADHPEPKRPRAANKENMPPPFATPARMATPAHVLDYMATPGYMQTPGHMATPAHMPTPAYMPGTPAYMPGTPAYMPGTPAYMPGTPAHYSQAPAYLTTPGHIPSNEDFENFANFGGGGADVNWDTPLHPEPVASSSAFTPAQTSFAAPVTDSFEQGSNMEEEEMLDGETIEAFEDRILNKRAAHLNTVLKTSLTKAQDKLPFSQLTGRSMRKQVAQKFYSILVLQKALAVNVQQEGVAGEIFISRGSRFGTAVF